MKFKASALAVVVLTVTAIMALRFVLNRSDVIPEVDLAKPELNEPIAKVKSDPAPSSNVPIDYGEGAVKQGRIGSADKGEEDAPKSAASGAATPTNLSDDDVKKIKAVAALTDQEITQQINELKKRLDSEDIFEQLDDGELTEEQEKDAKATLEKFALLGLEQTRRRFMSREPELKDPLYAHRESLKEIRELLDD